MKNEYQANVVLWLNCNLKCPYCWGVPMTPPSGWPVELEGELDQMRRFFTDTGRWTLSFSGGEPTIYPGFHGFCEKLAADGHRVEIFTNGTVPFAKAFPGDSIHAVSHVSFSYHVPHEEKERFDATFEDNTRYLRERGIDFNIVYVLYPGRKDNPAVVKERFQGLGGKVVFKAFQGELDGKHYPFSYSCEEIEEFAEVGDIGALYFMENGNHTPTFKQCRAGQEFFAISLRTGGVYACEQLMKQEVANFKNSDGAMAFQANVRQEPMVCPAKRCYCRLTKVQEEFLKAQDQWSLENYSAWQEISGPTAEAAEYWGGREKEFVDAVAKSFQGSKVYLWGGGIHTLFLLRLFREQGFDMERFGGIIDSNPFKHGRQILDMPIMSKEEFEARDGDTCSDILISSRAFEAEIHGDIQRLYGDRFNVVRLYDGQLDLDAKLLEQGFNF